MADYRRAIQLNPGAFDFHHNLAYILELYGKIDEALGVYAECLSHNPQCAKAYYRIGHLKQQHYKAYQESIPFYQKALQLNPSYIEAINDLSSVYYELKKYPQALKCFNRIIDQNPQYANAYKNRALIYREMKVFDKAILDLQKYLRLNPRAPQAVLIRRIIEEMRGK